MKLSWDAEEWDGSIWSEFSDSKIEFELEGGEVVEAPPFRSIKRQQERMDRGVQITRTYTLKELKELQRLAAEWGRHGAFRPLCSGTASIYFLMGEKDL